MLHRSHRNEIVANAAVFDAGWVPADFRSRDAELNTMATALEPILDGEPASGLFLHGPSGTGKTSSSQYLLGKLSEHAEHLETATVNCWSNHSRYRVLRRIVEAVDGLRARTRDHAAAALQERLAELETPTVVVLDEADQLDEPDVLYTLYELPALHVVATANTKADVLLGLDERIQSRLRTFHDVHFAPYTAAELDVILQQRVDHGLQPDVIEAAQVRQIARAANGNARDAIATLDGAAQRAVEDGAERIRDTHVETAIETASRAVRSETLDRLNDHQHAIYEIVAATEPASPGTIYERYRDRMADPRSRRTVRKYLRKLEQYDLLVASGHAQSREYRLGPDAPRPS
ncbi:orc1/cdc6 family replication initiation protein [Halodesulfurarchaeum sp. HSR-GB]|uniref:Cdc6/Cdc18 family protein n=1 Tax=Halodesulfurarchaeum sp. HSR-GB TaxID=3074077 RepID=UPI002858D5BF|nr:orc1/cdc6 family replication initiation protein [Halodesulfurarchaeum sp. HSR-GB]MDR5655772.1 orc1/cdc6 family replication initiation protein [Halodesulfurarchaeum sp. HSR-GB]